MAAAAVIIMMAGAKQSNCNCNVPLDAGEREFIAYAGMVCVIIFCIVACISFYRRD